MAATGPAGGELVCDVLVVGSGAAGLTAALTARVQGLEVHVIEKEALLGGCSAYSYGMMWMPGNPVAARAGLTDDRAAAMTYLRGEMGEHFDARAIDSYLEHGPRMLAFLERHAGLRFELREDFPDYHSERPGAAQRGRTLLPMAYDARPLGRDLQRLRSPRTSLLGLSFTPAENRLVSSRSPAGLRYLGRRLARQVVDLLVHRRSTHLTGGNALMAGLLKAAKDLGIPLHTQASLQDLLLHDGRITTALVQSPQRPWRVQVRRGVVLACGGFGQDLARCSRGFGHPPLQGQSWSLAPASCNGDGLRIAQALGARNAPVPQNAGFWVPVSRLPGFAGKLSIHSHDRFKPGFLAVTPRGQRFTNESDSNHHFCEALLRATPAGQPPRAWLVCDHRALSRIGLGDFLPGWPFPIGPHLRSGYLLRRDSLAALAEAMQVDAAVFQDSVARFNAHARLGRDPDFQRGSSRFNRCMGSPTATHPNLRALDYGPFYAVQISVGHMATLAGLQTDAEGRALDGAGQPIAGLYLAGNDRANLFRGTCPGGGITLGPGMTGAYLTGLALAQAHSPTAPAPTEVTPEPHSIF